MRLKIYVGVQKSKKLEKILKTTIFFFNVLFWFGKLYKKIFFKLLTDFEIINVIR